MNDMGIIALSHRFALLSIGLVGLLTAGSVAARDVGAASPYYGRWTVDEDRPAFTARGLQYKTIDVAPCGRDFCGVSVADGGGCGRLLFRFLGIHNDGESVLRGHANWGRERKNVVIYPDFPGDRTTHHLDLYLGNGYDFGERSPNMPMFHGLYRRAGTARCTAR
jgi:hypothetical protein